jgi:protein phosphatase
VESRYFRFEAPRGERERIMVVITDGSTVEESISESLEARAARYFGPTAVPVHVEVGALSHAGKVRANNEDHFVVVRRRRSRDVLATNLPATLLRPVHDDAYALAVADGVGGAVFGEVASMLALQAGWELTAGAFKWHFKITESEAVELLEMLRVYGQLIHRRLQEASQADPRLRGMGTTITAAISIGLDAFLAHVGDSRAYLFRNGALELLTRDHTAAQQLVDAGAIGSVLEASRFLRHMLVNSLGGQRPEVEVDTRHVQLADGDALLVCSDGLTDMVPEAEIAEILRRGAEPQTAAQSLVQAALEQGGRDNVTVVLAKYSVRTKGE